MLEFAQFDRLALAQQIDHLPAYHPPEPAASANSAITSSIVEGETRALDDSAERATTANASVNRPSTRQRGDRLAIHFVIGRPAAPQIVIIHAGQIVMDK